MKSKRDLWLMAAASLLVIGVLSLATLFGIRKQQRDLVQRFEDDLFHGRSEKAKYLIANTDVVHLVSYPNQEAYPAATLISGVLYCDPETVHMLISKDIDVNSRLQWNEKETASNATGYTALDYAVIHRRQDMVEVLLRNGADGTVKTAGETALDHLKNPPNIYWERGAKRVGTDAQIAHLLRQAQLQSIGKATAH